ncbi:MAG: hypothetical protein KGJ62_08120 [Armatimonadetes bacterium]|nr:hypothetical protein [Armatimonadota bacterium]MDE2205242.1 hypothetical protein [Armatimonadota bacterium]
MNQLFTLESWQNDRIVSAIAANGEVGCTVGRTGFHVASEDAAGETQRFTWAGRRRSGAQHPLTSFGTLVRTLEVDGEQIFDTIWRQAINPVNGVVTSELKHNSILETAETSVLLQRNVFRVETVLRNDGDAARSVVFRVNYTADEPDMWFTHEIDGRRVRLHYEFAGELGELTLEGDCSEPTAVSRSEVGKRGAAIETAINLGARSSVTLVTSMRFSDRRTYLEPARADTMDDERKEAERQRVEFQSASDVMTGDATVDAFRQMTLHTLRSTITKWSIPPAVGKPYWDGGAFHDELYPFLGLLSANHPELAARIPWFRLTTLPMAIDRAFGRGAHFPWSSDEAGNERDPLGPWLTEKFHNGQFALAAWNLWLYERDLVQLDDLYPLLREIARYYQMNALVRGPGKQLRTVRGVDFDEAAGEVENGPFTTCAAAASMEAAANAAHLLSRDAARAEQWANLARELRQNLQNGGSTWEPPAGAPFHMSVLAPVFPFRIEFSSARALQTAQTAHESLRSQKAFKPGLAEPYEQSMWTWAGAHLAAVHAWQGSGALAWEALRGGAASAGAFCSPNEHVDRNGHVRVPWFTTGAGLWLYALNALFVQVDEVGTRLLPAVPPGVPSLTFKHLRAAHGVLVSGRIEHGAVAELTASASRATDWRFSIPEAWAERIAADRETGRAGTASFRIALPTGETSLLRENR